MKNIFYQFVAGFLWLILIYYSSDLSIQPQHITVLRTSFLSVFSVFLITAISLRIEQKEQSYLIFLCLIPSYIYLYINKSHFIEYFFFTKFFFVILLFLLYRNSKGHTKSGLWDVLFPILIPFLVYFEFLLTLISCFSIFLIIKNYNFTFDKVESFNSFIKTSPLILISPLLPIFYRDNLSIEFIEISRANLEIIGMILSGMVAAIGNGLTMSYENLLHKISLTMCFIGTLFFVIAFTHNTIIIYLFLYEYVRIIMWIALTHFYKNNAVLSSFLAGTLTSITPIVLYVYGMQGNKLFLNGLFVGLSICTILIVIINQINYSKFNNAK